MRLLPFAHPRRWLAAWSEGELPEPRRRRIEAHLARCPACRERVEAIARGLAAARGLAPAPLSVERRQSIERALAEAGAGDRRRPLAGRAPAWRWTWPRWAVTAAAAGLALGLWLGRRGVEIEAAATPAGRFEALALSAHAAVGSGALPLDLATTSPAEARAWLGRRGLSAALAEERPADEAASYRLAGVTDVSRPGLTAAAVFYEVDRAPLLLVAARQEEVPEAPHWSPLGKRVSYRRVNGTGVLTWTNSGKAYALVADLPTLKRGCLLCHVDARRRELVRDLKLPAS